MNVAAPLSSEKLTWDNICLSWMRVSEQTTRFLVRPRSKAPAVGSGGRTHSTGFPRDFLIRILSLAEDQCQSHCPWRSGCARPGLSAVPLHVSKWQDLWSFNRQEWVTDRRTDQGSVLGGVVWKGMGANTVFRIATYPRRAPVRLGVQGGGTRGTERKRDSSG